jgi:5-methylcytosine-specific restriction endonuclease McrA
MTDFEKINGYLFSMFEDDMKKPIIIEIFKKHLSPNRYHCTEIASLLHYLQEKPPYKNILDKNITNKEFFNINITSCLKNIYNFDIAYEKNVVKRGCYMTNPNAEEQGHRYKLFIKELQDIIYKEEQENIKDIKNASNTCKKEETKKKKKKSISATIKRLVWNTNIGEDIGKSKCMCCKSTDITQMSFNCGHIVAEVNGGDTIVSNLKPICQNCNSSMGTKNMEDFMKSLK